MKTNKKLFITFLTAVLCIVNVFSQVQPVTFNKVPTTTEEFVALRNKVAVTPEGGCAIFVMAMIIYQNDIELGKKCFVIAVDRNELKEGNVYKGFDLVSWMSIKSGMENYPGIATSYVEGSKAEEGYAVSLPYVIKFGARNAYSGTDASGTVRTFVISSGADSPRPITMIRNNKGLWKASKFSSLFTGVKKGRVIVDDDL